MRLSELFYKVSTTLPVGPDIWRTRISQLRAVLRANVYGKCVSEIKKLDSDAFRRQPSRQQVMRLGKFIISFVKRAARWPQKAHRLWPIGSSAFLQFCSNNNRFLNQFPNQLCHQIKYLCILMKYESRIRIIPLAVKLTILEELNTSESLKKEDKTTPDLGKVTKVWKISALILLFERLTVLFFKETEWEMAMGYGFDLGKKEYRILISTPILKRKGHSIFGKETLVS